MSARRFSLWSSLTFEREPTETKRVFPSRENSRSRVQWPPPPTCSRPLGMLLTMTSAGPRALASPLWYGNRTTESGVADIDVRWIGPGRIEGDPERPCESRREVLARLGLAVAVRVAQDLDAAGHALGEEDVAVGGGDDLARIA